MIFSMSETLRSLPDIEFPTNPIERMGLVLSGAINSGPKSTLVMLFPSSREYIENSDLTASFREVVSKSKTPFADATSSWLIPYCKYSLEDVGLVAQILEIDHAGVVIPIGYRLTEAGEKYGVPAAARALYFESQYKDISLYKVFGQTASRGKEKLTSKVRAPALRAEILLCLEDNKDSQLSVKRIKSLISPQHELEAVEAALSTLEREKCVKITKSPSAHYMAYELSGKQDLVPSKYIKGEQSIDIMNCAKSICLTNGTVTTEDIFDALYAKYQSKQKDPYRFKRYIREILSKLVKYGFLKKQGKWKWAELFIENTEKGSIISHEFLSPLLSIMQEQDSEENARIVNVVRGDLSAYALNAIDRYYPHSPGYMRKHMAEVDSQILMLLAIDQAVQEGLTMNDFVELTGEKPKSLSHRLDKLIKRKLIRIEGKTKSHGYRYFIIPQQ